MWQPIVSIVTPSFNQGEFIEETIESVLNQDYPSIEYLVIDGGSSDNTLSVLEKYDKQLSWISEPDQGQADAINKGWHMAKGDVLAWINSDDVYEKGAIRSSIEVLENNPDACLVYGDAKIIDRNGKTLGLHKSGRGDKNRLLWFGQHIPQPSTFMRRGYVQKIHGLNTSINTKLDFDFFIRMSLLAPFVYLPRVQARMRFYADTKSLTNVSNSWNEKITILKKHNPLWFLTFIHFQYVRYKLWVKTPVSFQRFIRRWRGLPRDKAGLEPPK